MKPSINCLTRRVLGFVGVALVIVATLAIRAALGDDAIEPKEARATLRVGIPQRLAGNAPIDTNMYEQYRGTQVLLLKSDLVLGAALREEGILDLPVLKAAKGEPKRWLQDNLLVIAPLGSEVVQVKLPGEDPAQAAKIVNAVVDSYVKNVVDAEHADALNTQATLEGQLKSVEKELSAKREALSELQLQTTRTSEFARERYGNLDRLLTDIRQRRLDLDMKVAAAKTRLAKAAADSAQAADATLELAVADAQGEVLQKARDELAAELHEIIAGVDAAGRHSAVAAHVTTEISQLETARSRLMDRLQSIEIELKLPPRVIVLERAK
jgi:polysaccharide biosynthesis transport protein